MENNENNIIDLKKIFTTLWEKRKVFYWVLPTVFVLSTIIVFIIPHKWTCRVAISPSISGTAANSSIMDLASSLGLEMTETSGEVIYPQIYPDVIKSNDFLVGLFDIPVASIDSSFTGTYYNYVKSKRITPFWKKWKSTIMKMFRTPRPKRKEFDLFQLTEEEDATLKQMKQNISCTMHKKTGIITITVTERDPQICALLAHNAQLHLQDFIREHRTQKVKAEIEYFKVLIDEAQQQYTSASVAFINYADSNSSINREKDMIQRKNLENDMNMKYSLYTSYVKQYATSCSKLQDHTPVFTVIEQATIPIYPTGPRRIILILFFCGISFIITSVIICWKEIVALLA